MPAAALSTVPAAALPLGVHSNTVLSQDVITSASILVDSTSPAPVAAFTSLSNGEDEALAVVNNQVTHILRDRQTDSGWRAIPLFGGQTAKGVAACAPFQSTVYGFFVDGDDQLHSTSLAAAGQWSPPVPVAGGTLSHPRVAYTKLGAAVVYGKGTKGDLVTVHQTGMTDPFIATTHPVQGALAGDDFQLCMIDEVAFTVLANLDGKANTITGELTQPNVVGPALVAQMTDKVTNIALGYASPAGQSMTAIFILVAEDATQKTSALHCWSQASTSEPAVQKITNGSISVASGHVSLDGSLHVYAVDDELGLWVLHQSSRQPWGDDGTPNWVPFLPIDKGIGRVIGDMNPAAAPTLFAVDGGDYSLRLHAIDPVSRLWKTSPVLQHAAEAYDVTRHRAEIRVVDANGRALCNHEVTVTVEKGCSAVDVWAGGRVHLIDERGTTLATDLTGKLTVAVTATEHGLACPNLVVTCDGLPSPATVRPAGGLHEYLSGKGTLNPTNPTDRGGGPLPAFTSDGETLKKATVNGKPLAPGASNSSDPGTAANVAGSIQQGALIALGNPPPGVSGFGGSLLEGQTSFQVFQTPGELQAHAEGAGLTLLGSFWDELKDFFGDIFEGIKNFVIKVAHFVVDVADKIVQFTLDFAEFVGQALHLPIDGIEKAASFMHGFFNSVDAGIDKVVHWLEALFDFGAIWRTKMAIQQGVEAFAPYVVKVAGEAQKVADGWFATQKAALNKAFDAIEAKYTGQTYGQLGHWQDPCAPPSTAPVAGHAAPSDFTANPHHNWLNDKVTSYPPDTSSLPISGSIDDLWNNVASHFSDSGSEFRKALDDFRAAVWTTVSDPSSFAKKAVPELIEMARNLALAVLDLLDAILDSIAALVGTGMDLLHTAFGAELPLGFLNTLWKWMAEGAGYPDDAKLTLYALGALAAALPATLIFKLIEGVDHEPFPSGKLPAPLATPMAGLLGVTMPWGCILASDIIRMLQVIPAGAADVLASDSPGWLTGINLVLSGSVWILRHGYPDEWQWLLFALALSGPALVWAIPRALGWWQGLHKDDSNDIAAFVGTAFGLASLAYGIYLDATTSQEPGMAIATILTPLPSMFAWLTLSPIRLNVDLAPFAIAGNVVFDGVGYVGGGLELLLDTLAAKGTQA